LTFLSFICPFFRPPRRIRLRKPFNLIENNCAFGTSLCSLPPFGLPASLPFPWMEGGAPCVFLYRFICGTLSFSFFFRFSLSRGLTLFFFRRLVGSVTAILLPCFSPCRVALSPPSPSLFLSLHPFLHFGIEMVVFFFPLFSEKISRSLHFSPSSPAIFLFFSLFPP